jgi:hypothetical protein
MAECVELQGITCKTAKCSLSHMEKFVETHQTCFKTEIFSLRLMAKCVRLQEINVKKA